MKRTIATGVLQSRGLWSVPVAALVLGFTGAPPKIMAPPPLLTDGSEADTAIALPADPGVKRSRVVRISPELLEPGAGTLQQPGSRFTANLFDDASHAVLVKSVNIRGPAEFSCVGQIENIPGSSVVIAAYQGALAGTVTVPWTEPFQIQFAGNGLHRVNQVSLLEGDWCATMEPQLTAAEPVPNPRTPLGADDDPPTVIDFLVLYTPQALAGAGSEEGIRALIDFAIAENNFCYENSGINVRWNVVGQQLASYHDSGSLRTDWAWLRDNSETLRNLYRADLVMLLVETDRFGTAGIAGGNHTAFLRPVINLGTYVVTHEVGHLLGAGHDRFTCAYRSKNSGCGAFYSFSYGYRFPSEGINYSTIMAYEPGRTIPYYSNPDVLFRGVPTGVAAGTNAANNAATITQRAPAIADLRGAWCRFDLATNALGVSEKNTRLTLDILRTGDLSRTGSVECVTTAGTAAANQDFVPATLHVAFDAGEDRKQVEISLLDDSVSEGDETFVVSLRLPGVGTALGPVSSCRVTIQDDEVWVGFAKTTSVVSEGDGTAVIPVVRGGDLSPAVTVNVSTENLTAAAGQDFVETSTALVFAPGETEKMFTVPVTQDDLVEPEEQLTLRISDPEGSIPQGLKVATLTIADDERPGSLNRGFIGIAWPGRVRSFDKLQVYPDGRFLVSGSFILANGAERAFVLRCRRDGSPDPDFHPAEFLPTPTPEAGLYPAQVSLALDSLGRIYASGGLGSVNGVAITNVVRLNADGTPDTSFKASFDSTDSMPWGPTPILLPLGDGKVLASGGFHFVNGQSRPYLARLNEDGSLDLEFNPSFNPDTISLGRCAVQDDGKVLVTGLLWGVEGQSRDYFARLNPDGSLDRLFYGRVNGLVVDVRMLRDQRILLAGGFTTPRRGVAILNRNGTVDQAFDPKTVIDGLVRCAEPLPDGRLLVAGLFTTTGLPKQNYLLRLNSDGSVDPSFNCGGGPNDTVAFAVQEPAGSVLAFGKFSTFNGQPVQGLMRLCSDGTRPTFGPVTLLSDGRCAFELFGNAGQKYSIETSADLVQWSPLRQETFTGPCFQWSEVREAGPARFYRARELK